MSFTFVGIAASRHCLHGPLLLFQTKLASISAGVWALCMRPNCSGLGPDVRHPAVLSLARSPSFIDFPLLCHCGGLFKHTLCDVRPHTVWHPKATAFISKREAEHNRGCSAIWWGVCQQLQMCCYFNATAHVTNRPTKDYYIIYLFYTKKEYLLIQHCNRRPSCQIYVKLMFNLSLGNNDCCQKRHFGLKRMADESSLKHG